ncbi:hypothetical protein [Haloplanus halophilus]|uniref:hypothetical protein n=1 Tax=Haloplanus halophilus TaxID=2949993 RepID=UPI00203CBDBD|nr:hypothetical protein [Haloplanus sp. GDY1]
MRRSVRYGIAAAVGVGLAALVAVVSGSLGLPLLSVAVVYGATTAVVLAHRETWGRLNGRTTQSRTLGAVSGGVGAFAGSTLLQVSVPVGVTGIGLMLFGMAVTVADVSTLDG